MNNRFKEFVKKRIRALKRKVTFNMTLKKEYIVKECGFNEIVWKNDDIWGYKCAKTGEVITIIELQKMSFVSITKLFLRAMC